MSGWEYVRPDGRGAAELRPMNIQRNYIKYPEGSVLVEAGDTRVIVNVTVQSGVPRWLRGSGRGWITAEYSMLPRATEQRNIRDVNMNNPPGRNQEIQRLIGRCLRSVVELDRLGENTLWVDCDVIQADGGTRTVSITGGFVAMIDALYYMVKRNEIKYLPLNNSLVAVSCGLVNGIPLLDLDYAEDSRAQVDLNVVGTGDGSLVEVQGTAEGHPFTMEELDRLMTMAREGLDALTRVQQETLGSLWDEVTVGIARLHE
ncbi:MAG: ribonuclease PH [Bacillota bacterium]